MKFHFPSVLPSAKIFDDHGLTSGLAEAKAKDPQSDRRANPS
jgi:hypothetical protein